MLNVIPELDVGVVAEAGLAKAARAAATAISDPQVLNCFMGSPLFGREAPG